MTDIHCHWTNEGFASCGQFLILFSPSSDTWTKGGIHLHTRAYDICTNWFSFVIFFFFCAVVMLDFLL